MLMKTSSHLFSTKYILPAIALTYSLTPVFADNLFVGDTGYVDKISPGGAGVVFASGFNNVKALAFNSSGNLFVADGGSSIDEIFPNGSGVLFASGFNNASALAFNSMGDLFVADGSYVDKILPSGAGVVFASGFNNTRGLAFNSTGDLFVADGGNVIDKLSPTGAGAVFASGFNNAGAVCFPSAIIPEPVPNWPLMAWLACALLWRRRKTAEV